jgi:hypothetical protein
MPNSFLYHKKNLVGKIQSNYKQIGDVFREFKETVYDRYQEQQCTIVETDEQAIHQKVQVLYEYYGTLDEFVSRVADEHGKKITPQSKFRPTVLEEFCGFLFKDLPQIEDLGLDFFNKKIFAGITLDKEGKAKIKTKDVDFCIGKQFNVKIGNENHVILIPIVAIEVKTYIDKTMFSEAQFTAQKMKQGSPNVRVYVLTEENQIDVNEIPTKGQTPIDQIFVIRDKTTQQISSDAVFEFYCEVKSVLEQIRRDTIINSVGGLLPD